MVIHDLRTPAESIQLGLLQAQEIMKCKILLILNSTRETFKKQILVSRGSHKNESNQCRKRRRISEPPLPNNN
jgi:hypothetical protein